MVVSGLLGLIIYLVVAGLICWLLWWLIDFIGIPEPFHKVAKVIVAVVAVIVIINVLLGIGGPSNQLFHFR
jgi:hypothetical protein